MTRCVLWRLTNDSLSRALRRRPAIWDALEATALRTQPEALVKVPLIGHFAAVPEVREGWARCRDTHLVVV